MGVSLARMSKGSGHSPLLDPVPDPARYAVVLGANVKRLREEAKLKKTTFSLMVGIGRPLLDKIENGVSNVRLAVVVSLADALDTTPADLLTRHEEYEASYLDLEEKAKKIMTAKAEKEAREADGEARRANMPAAPAAAFPASGHAKLF